MGVDLAGEARLLGAALTTLTRLPCPLPRLRADWLARAAKFFPLVGALVGALAGAAMWGAALLWPSPVPALLGIGAALLLTGALHEDGLADVADAAGARERERKLAIMKDPRLGVFGGLALIVVLGLKVAALSSLPPERAAAALVAAGAASRLWAVVVMSRAGYAGNRDLAKLDHGIEGPRTGEVALAVAFALPPLLLLGEKAALGGLALSALAAGLVAVPVCRALGGYSGDVLGAVIATSETAFLLGAAIRP
ncbi:adenosylcobinamide-GDP ribazoletransferase [Enterovirga sp.]|uniref:adenosylcobinamide-GDP ribazoletransferase n=1 Tax=Enterovirga sp. TaxID=2026350 RepID=UPI002D0F0A4B|nr:adenosylcobinamide-GDP ribazoletransferase [Enterovirga sp.]HMO27990.1 adenosylcobinamide-GDP ribazoletransferase [Enterovirga sp.]